MAIRFCVSGGIATALHYLVMLLVINIGFSPGNATAVGAIAGALVNYVLQHRLTFDSRKKHLSASTRYVVAVALSWLLNLAFFTALHSGLAMHVYAAQILTTLLVALCNYWIFKRFVFL